MSNDRVFGEIAGCPEGAEFASYKELNEAKVHMPTQAGISGSQEEGADSIVVSGGYEDDQDFGDEIIYTGHGGRDDSGKQIADQTLMRGNMALAKNEIENFICNSKIENEYKYEPARSIDYPKNLIYIDNKIVLEYNLQLKDIERMYD